MGVGVSATVWVGGLGLPSLALATRTITFWLIRLFKLLLCGGLPSNLPSYMYAPIQAAGPLQAWR
jgi:hypothetical protein